jgi:hypothetical protein
MLLVVHKRVHSLIRLFCFVGEYFRPSQGLWALGQEGGQSRRHRRRRRCHRRRLRLRQAGLRHRHVGVGRLPVVGRTVSCPTRRRRSDRRQHGGGEGVVAALVGGGARFGLSAVRRKLRRLRGRRRRRRGWQWRTHFVILATVRGTVKRRRPKKNGSSHC